MAIGLALLAYTLLTLMVLPLAERLSLRYRPDLVIPAALFIIGLGFILMSFGPSPLLVEQNAMAALEIADRSYVIEAGRLVHAGPASQLLSDTKVKAPYLGLEGRRYGRSRCEAVVDVWMVDLTSSGRLDLAPTFLLTSWSNQDRPPSIAPIFANAPDHAQSFRLRDQL